MNIYPVKIPFVIKSIFNKWTWSVKTQKKEVYLTFDDGPIPKITPWVLEQLKIFNAKATFFCIGDNIKKHPQIFQQVLKEGHRVGNHTFNHLNGWKTNSKNYINNSIQAQQYLTENKPKLFRPPYGKLTPKQSKNLIALGYKIIMWDVLSGDFDDTISADTCTQNVLNTVTKGSVIVFHDSEKAFKRLKTTLPIVLKELNKRGYQFKTL